jgi:hypothetical protein
MIRCIPVDGSAPFEVENDTRIVCPTPDIIVAADFARDGGNVHLIHDAQYVSVRLESWRERAWRVERELDIVRLARNWSEAQRSYEHGDFGAMDDISEIETALLALGVTREEAMRL